MNFKSVNITILLLFLATSFFAQDNTESVSDQEEKTIYEIANISITGANHTDEKSVLARSGLQVGKKINLKGYDISRAIQNLMRTILYKDVKIHQVRTVEDLIFFKNRNYRSSSPQ